MAMSEKKEVYGGFASVNLRKPDLMQDDPKKGDYVKGKEEFLEQINSGGGSDSSQNANCLTDAEKTLILSLFRNAAYTADMSATFAQLETLWSGGNVEPDEPIIPDEPVNPEKTLTSISAVYSGGDVTAGTAVSALTGIVVTAHYSDGTSATVTGYTLSGTIAEGSNTITVTYGGRTTTFTVIGTAESGGEEIGNDPFAGTWVEDFRLDGGTEYPTGHNGHDTTDYVDCSGFDSVTISTEKTTNVKINSVSWYDGNKVFINAQRNKYVHASSATYPASETFTKPEGSAYCRICVLGYENVTISVM